MLRLHNIFIDEIKYFCCCWIKYDQWSFLFSFNINPMWVNDKQKGKDLVHFFTPRSQLLNKTEIYKCDVQFI